jgi:hypothetical protein
MGKGPKWIEPDASIVIESPVLTVTPVGVHRLLPSTGTVTGLSVDAAEATGADTTTRARRRREVSSAQIEARPRVVR